MKERHATQPTFRPCDLRDAAGYRPTAAEAMAEPEHRQPRDEKLAECVRVIRAANPGASETDVFEAAKTLTSYNLHSALQDDFTPHGARRCLRAYAAVVEAALAQADRAARAEDAEAEREEAEDRRHDNPLEPDFRRLGQ